VYYDLLEEKESKDRKDVAIVRIEQLYPLPFAKIDAVVEKYENAEYIWVQEEPANMGAWSYLRSCYRSVELEVVCRKASASPATGYSKLHQYEQEQIVKTAFGHSNAEQNEQK
jgi:2-oxoglutarate dehydrogenase E1 component